jgi:hypothetical protein
MTDRAWRLAPVAAALLTVAAYFAIDPRISDLPAAEFRAWLFEHEGFTVWNNNWYAGHHTPGYSILYPPLSAWLGGPEVVGAIYTVAAAALFEPLLRHHFGAKAARWPAILFGFAAGTLLFSSRLPWGLGATFGIASVLALQRNRPWLAAALATLATLSSPVAGAFLAMIAVAYVLADRTRLKAGAGVAIGGLLPPLVLTAMFPEGGYHPFVFSSFFIVPLVALGFVWLLPDKQRTLRIASLLYALAAIGLFIVPTPFGGNTVRLGQLIGAPLVLAALIAAMPLSRARAGAGVALVVVLVWWQWAPIVREYRKVEGDPSTQAAYYKPVTDFLKTQPGPLRVEVPNLRSQWETYYVAKEAPLARGWLRQLDVKLNPLFYEDGEFSAQSFENWLTENAVTHVALADAKLGYAGEDEGRLIRSGGADGYLRPVFRSEHWTVYEVTAPHPLVVSEGGADMEPAVVEPESVQIDVRRPGSAIVRVHFSPYWTLDLGCVERAGDWTRITTGETGLHTLKIDFTPTRALDRGRRCG